MNDELLVLGRKRRSLEERLTQRPDVLARFHRMADLLDQSVKEGGCADGAEARVIEALRQLGQEVMTPWALETNAPAQAQVRHEHPPATRYGKKKSAVAHDSMALRCRRNGCAGSRSCTAPACVPWG